MNSNAPLPNDDIAQQIADLQKQLRDLRAQQSQDGSPAPAPPAAPPAPSASDGGVEVASIQDGDNTLRRLVQRIAMILQAEKVVIMFHERETGELIGIPPTYGLDEHTLSLFKVRATQGVSGLVFREGVPCIYHDAITDPRTRKDMVQMLKVSNGITVPLVIERRDEENRVVDRTTIGVLHAFNKKSGEDFNDEDVRLLDRMSRNVGSIIANLQLYKEVLQEREQLAQTFESLTSGLILVSPAGRISQMNAIARTVFRTQEGTGKDLHDLTNDESLIGFIESGLEGREPGPFEMTIDFHGQERIYSTQGALVRNESGQILGYVVIFNDVTEQKAIDRMKSNFVAMASHELRTPLTAIKGFSQTLLDGVDDAIYGTDEQKEFLGIISQECDRLRRLIDDLLNTARIEAGESLKPNYSRVELRDLVEKVAMVQNQASVKHHVYTIFHSDLPETIIADQDKLDQIFTNLLNNAIKYSPEGGDVIIHAKADADWCVFGIQDQGIGIPKDHLGKVFERFHRVDNDDNRKIYGTGLGLFLVKHLVDKVHLGEIWAESDLGKGSTFWFKVPVKLDVERAQAEDQ
jgi:PAS domain S-box-containing protein